MLERYWYINYKKYSNMVDKINYFLYSQLKVLVKLFQKLAGGGAEPRLAFRGGRKLSLPNIRDFHEFIS
jgi:hypothetical protein